MATAPQRYAGKVTRVGNSKGIRLDAAFFKAHPEFGGEVQATVLAEGQLLLSATTKGRTRGKKADTVDPVVVSFLGFLERQMRAQPERIRPLDAKLLDGIGELVKGVDVE